MEAKEIFAILQIEATRDKNAIRAAYRRLLVHVNPEDDPEGFKRLRQAYEEACRLADAPEDDGTKEQEAQDDSPMGRWIGRAEKIYVSLQSRVSLPCWKELFEDELCQALDTADEARERFLVFLMSHFRFPQAVWRLFDQEFFILEQRKQLLEKFPQDFISYVCFEIQNGGFIDFSLFEGPDEGPWDEYINIYLQVKRQTDMGTEQGEDGQEEKKQARRQAWELLGQLDEMEVWHPFAEVEQLRLYLAEGEEEKAREKLEFLLSLDYSNPYIILQCGYALEQLGRTAEARQQYEGLLERQPDNYPAGVGLVRCQLEMGDFAAAKERAMDLLDISKTDPEILDCMHRANAHLIPEMEERLKANPDDWAERIELGWCYFQEERGEDCAALLTEQDASGADVLDYCNILSRTYLLQRDYEKALPLFEKWQKLMEELPDSDDPGEQKKKKRLGYTYYAAAYCKQEMGRGQEAAEDYDKAIEKEKDEDMKQSYMMAKAQLLCRLGRFEESVDACDRLIERNPQYVPAFVCRQECFYRMHRAQAVVDEYHRLRELYRPYLPPYLMAAKVFHYYRQYKDSMDVIEAAREQGLTSAELDFFEARNLRYLAEKKADLDRPKELCRQVIDWLQTHEQKEEDRQPGEEELDEAEVWKELVFCYMDERNWAEAAGIVAEALRRFPGEDGLRYAKAGILKGQGSYQEAENLYRQLLKDQPENTVIMGQLAECLEHGGRRDEREKLYKAILKQEPENVRAMSRLLRIYGEKMNERRDVSYFHRAMELADKLIKLRPEAYYYIERGLILTDDYRLEEALADYEKAMELEPDNLYAYNNAGVNYRHLDQFDRAEENYDRAIALLGEEDKSVLPWQNKMVLRMIQGRYREALQCLEENEKLFPGRASFYMDRGEILERMGRFDEAIEVYKKYLAEKEPGSRQAQVKIADAYASKGDLREASKRYKRMLKDHPGDRWLENQYIEHLIEVARDFKTAYNILKRQLAAEPDSKETVKKLADMVQVLFFLGRQQEKQQYFERARGLLQTLPRGEESYAGIGSTAPCYLYHLGELYLYGGEPDKAEAYFRRMMDSHRCEFCRYGGCFEAFLGMGILRMYQRRFEEAEAYFRRCLAANPQCSQAAYYMNNRRKW